MVSKLNGGSWMEVDSSCSRGFLVSPRTGSSGIIGSGAGSGEVEGC